MNLASIVERYSPQLHALSQEQQRALWAIQHCRTAVCGTTAWRCDACAAIAARCRSCGHRFCPQCQHQETVHWLDKQARRLLPVSYFMATFTLPYELRSLAQHHPVTVYGLLLTTARDTLRTFAYTLKGLGGEIGVSAVLHTHTRALDYHPHVHVIIPGGCLLAKRRQWKKLQGDYLFNGFALAEVFRARLLAALEQAGFRLPTIPKKWVVHVKKVGSGLPALQYLSRYLYRGVISEKHILRDDGTEVTFRYQDNKKRWHTRTLPGKEFLLLLVQHVLPKGFRRTRNYGFLHGNAKKVLSLVQLILRVALPPPSERPKAHVMCSQCQQPMVFLGFRPYRGASG